MLKGTGFFPHIPTDAEGYRLLPAHSNRRRRVPASSRTSQQMPKGTGFFPHIPTDAEGYGLQPVHPSINPNGGFSP